MGAVHGGGAGDNAWDAIYRADGRVFDAPFQRFEELAEQLQARGRTTVLDLGCGSGRHLVALERRGFRVVGIDRARAGLDLARAWSRAEGLPARLAQADMRARFPFRSESFSALLSTQVIHHARLAAIRATVAEIARVLQPGGLAFVTVAGRTTWVEDGVPFEEIEPGTTVPLAGPEAGLPHHVFTPDSLAAEFARFQIEEVSAVDDGRVIRLLALRP